MSSVIPHFDPVLQGQNKLINPQFVINQRGVQTGLADGNYFSDRWFMKKTGTVATSIDTTLIQLYQPQNWVKPFIASQLALQLSFTSPTAGGSFYIAQRILRGPQIFLGNTKAHLKLIFSGGVTLDPAARVGYSLVINYGSGGSASTQKTINGGVLTPKLQSYTTSDVIYRVDEIIDINSSMGTDTIDGLDSWLEVRFWFSWAASNTELGSPAAQTTPLKLGAGSIRVIQLFDASLSPEFLDDSEHVDPYIEFYRCKQFFERIKLTGTNRVFANGFNDTVSLARHLLRYDAKWKIPTVNYFGTLSTDWNVAEPGANNAPTSITFDMINNDSCRVLSASSSAFTAVYPNQLIGLNSNAYIDVLAEV